MNCVVGQNGTRHGACDFLLDNRQQRTKTPGSRNKLASKKRENFKVKFHEYSQQFIQKRCSVFPFSARECWDNAWKLSEASDSKPFQLLEYLYHCNKDIPETPLTIKTLQLLCWLCYFELIFFLNTVYAIPYALPSISNPVEKKSFCGF